MAKAILGKKIGMTQVYNEQGEVIPVSVIVCEDNVVLQQKTKEKDGYVATQLGHDELKEKIDPKHKTTGHGKKYFNSPEAGHAKKAGVVARRNLKEVRFDQLDNELAILPLGSKVTVEIFQEGELVDVQALSKGKGFSGSIKRHNQTRGPETHGSNYHRAPGSMGPTKGKMIGKNLPGHMGHETVTIQNLKVIKVLPEHQTILVNGAVPGANNGLIFIKTSIKHGK